jgi:replicative DNA helicase
VAGSVHVLNATYRGVKIQNQTFTLARSLDSCKPGKIQVRNEGQIPGAGRQIFIEVSGSKDFEVMDTKRKSRETTVSFTVDKSVIEPVSTETDDEAMDRIATRFAILDEMTQAAINSDIRAMIVSGPPGVGKSFGVETQLEKATLFDKLSNKKIRFEIVKGAMTPLGLYAQLYKFSDPKNVLVFDDCDSAFSDELALNILKAALDSGKRRRIFWNSDSALLRREGIPDNFEFKGSVIFITNLDFENVKSKKISDHLEALQSRCHYLDLTINSERDKMLRIRQVHRDVSKDKIGGLFADYEFPEGKDTEILDFMWENRTKLREVSLRMALKIADLVKISPTNWKILTQNTCMRAK